MVIGDFDLQLDVDAVLRGQGMDPSVIRRRRPALAELAERALAEERALLQPQVVWRRLPVLSFAHRRLTLAEGGWLAGKACADYLARAQEIVVLVCTVGPAIDARVAELMPDAPAHAMAVDGLGNAAVEGLERTMIRRIAEDAAGHGMRITLPCAPGMTGWPLDEGQRQLFALLDAASIGVSLAPSGRMSPRKTTSCALGVGCNVEATQPIPCDICAVRETCRFRGDRERPAETGARAT